jgi:ATP-dependent Lhr-like helicase
MRIIVEEVEAEKPTVPSWFSEQLPLSYDLALRIQRFRGTIEKMVEEEKAIEYLINEYNLERNAAYAIFNYFREQKLFSDIPTDRKLVVEKFEENGRYYYVFHTLVGRKANSAISRVFAYRAGMMKDCNVQIALNDNGFMLILPRYLRNREILELFSMEGFVEHLRKSLDRTEVLRRRFRHVAVRAMMILRNYLGREKSVWRQQMNSDSILRLIKRNFPDFPVLRETYREIMEDSMDLKNALDYLSRVGNEIEVRINRIPYPSPFAFNLYVLGEEDVVLMEDRRRVLRALHEKIMQIIAQSVATEL